MTTEQITELLALFTSKQINPTIANRLVGWMAEVATGAYGDKPVSLELAEFTRANLKEIKALSNRE